MLETRSQARQSAAPRSAYEIIRGWIFERRIPPGAKLSERTMAEQLGLSRVPVREAFQRLTLEGLLDHIPSRGLCLREYNEQDIADLYMYREALDGMAARIFAIRSDEMETGYLRLIYQEMERMMDDYHSRYWEQKDLEFHTIIARGSRNARILNAFSSVLFECLYLAKVYGERGEAEDVAPPHLREVVEEHARILEAVSSGDGDRAEKVARDSVRAGRERIMRCFVSFHRNMVTGLPGARR